MVYHRSSGFMANGRLWALVAGPVSVFYPLLPLLTSLLEKFTDRFKNLSDDFRLDWKVPQTKRPTSTLSGSTAVNREETGSLMWKTGAGWHQAANMTDHQPRIKLFNRYATRKLVRLANRQCLNWHINDFDQKLLCLMVSSFHQMVDSGKSFG